MWAARRDVEKYAWIHYTKDGTIVVTDKRSRLSITDKPNSVVGVKAKNGAQKRAIYEGQSRMTTRIDNTNHGNAKRYPFGVNGEHAHDIVYGEHGKPIAGTRELTDKERQAHRDLFV